MILPFPLNPMFALLFLFIFFWLCNNGQKNSYQHPTREVESPFVGWMTCMTYVEYAHAGFSVAVYTPPVEKRHVRPKLWSFLGEWLMGCDTSLALWRWVYGNYNIVGYWLGKGGLMLTGLFHNPRQPSNALHSTIFLRGTLLSLRSVPAPLHRQTLKIL